MLEKIQTLVGYATAPRAAYVLKHPIRSVRLLRMRRSLKNAVSPRLALGIGAAAVAVPVGLWLGRKIRGL